MPRPRRVKRNGAKQQRTVLKSAPPAETRVMRIVERGTAPGAPGRKRPRPR